MLMLLTALVGSVLCAVERQRIPYLFRSSSLVMAIFFTQTQMEENGSGATSVRNFITILVSPVRTLPILPGLGTVHSIAVGSRVS